MLTEHHLVGVHVRCGPGFGQVGRVKIEEGIRLVLGANDLQGVAVKDGNAAEAGVDDFTAEATPEAATLS